MKYLIVLAALFCIGLIGLSVYIASQQDAGSGPRLTPINDSYDQRLKDGTWVKGNRDAKIVVQEYADYQCPACRSMYSIMNDVMAAEGDKIRFEYHNFPLTTIHNKAVLADKGAEAAGRQGKYWEMHDMLYARQIDWSTKLPSSFENDMADMARSIGMNVEQFKRDLKDPGIEDPINVEIQKADSLGLTATPTIYVNGKTIDKFPQDAKEMLQIIKTMAGQ